MILGQPRIHEATCSACSSPEARLKDLPLHRLCPDHVWIAERLVSLPLMVGAGRWVAVSSGKVVAVEVDEKDLRTAVLRAGYGGRAAVARV